MGESTRNRDFERERSELVDSIRQATDISDRRVLNAFFDVPRHLFVSASQRALAYEDRALPIGNQQTISQPSMIAIMLAALQTQPTDRALEVGAGSGYAAALLSHLVREVDALELRPSLAARARYNLDRAGIRNVRVHVADGSLGLPERAPFDRILVSAAASTLPQGISEQLGPHGRIAVPVGTDLSQTLMLGERKTDGAITWDRSVACLFVPLVE